MYKTIVRAMVRRNVARLNAGDAAPMLKLASNDVQLRFPGDNSWSTMFRPAANGRAPHATHRASKSAVRSLIGLPPTASNSYWKTSS